METYRSKLNLMETERAVKDIKNVFENVLSNPQSPGDSI